MADNFKLNKTFTNSPPMQGCPQDGVVNNYKNKNIIAIINDISIRRNFIENLPHNPELKQLAKDKRHEGILSEVLFWQQVHKGRFYNIDFDRQKIIGNYIVDFYVKTLGLVIEIDGGSHDEKTEYDEQRQKYLESLGLKVFRVDDIDIKNNIERVMEGLEQYIINEYGENIETTKFLPLQSQDNIGTTPSCGHPSIGGELECNKI